MEITVVVPVYNEEEVIQSFLTELSNICQLSASQNFKLDCLIINDGSTDRTRVKIKELKLNMSVSILDLSRNFGHQSAVWAGLEKVSADKFVVVIDADLQDPPSEILNIVSEFKSGMDVVLMQRLSREDGIFKKFFANFYYSLNAWLTDSTDAKNIADFYGISPVARRALLQNRESVKYIRGLLFGLGFNRSIIGYHRNRRLSGRTHYSIRRMFLLALSGITGFSIKPLIWVAYFACLGSIISLCMAIYVFVIRVQSKMYLPPGWAFLSITLLILSTLILLGLAVISLYIARLTQEIKQRPIYYLRESENT
jgi:dolichol-phosphate mannosyltransferase